MAVFFTRPVDATSRNCGMTIPRRCVLEAKLGTKKLLRPRWLAPAPRSASIEFKVRRDFEPQDENSLGIKEKKEERNRERKK